MRLNKTVAKSLVFAMALSVLPVVGERAKVSAAIATTFDGNSGIVATNEVKFWGIAKKLKKKPKKVDPKKHITVADATYEVKAVEAVIGNEINLSKFKGKALFFAVGKKAVLDESGADWEVKEVKAGDNKLKAYFTMTDSEKVGKLTVDPAKSLGKENGHVSLFGTDEANPKNLAIIDLAAKAEAVEVKKGFGDWTTLKTFLGTADDANMNKQLGVLLQSGTNLSFRLKGTADTWVSKEAKLRIAKRAAAPKVSIKDDKIKLKKGMEFAAVDTTATSVTSWTAVDDAKKYDTLDKLTIDGTKDKHLYLRTKTTAKKVNSKEVKLVLKKQDAPDVVEDVKTNGIKNQGGDIIADQVAMTLNLSYDVKKGATLTNKSVENDYEVAISFDGSETGLKWLKLKKAKDAEHPTKIKISAATAKKNGAFDVNKTSKLFIRKPASKLENNEMSMQSPKVGVAIKLEKIEQPMTITSTNSTLSGLDIAKPDATEFKLKVAKATAADFAIAAKIANVLKKSGKPKFKVTGLPQHVKASISEFTEASDDVTFNINVSIDENAFKEAPNAKFTFTVEHESLKAEYTVSIVDSAGP